MTSSDAGRDIEAILQKAEEQLTDGQAAKAAALCEEALRQVPDSLDSKRLLALAKIKLKDESGALALLEEIEPHFENDLRTQLAMADTKWQLRGPEETVRHFEKAVKLAPYQQFLRVRLGLALLASKQFEEARAEMTSLLAITPDYPGALTNLGVALINLHRKTEAEEVLRRAMTVEHKNHAPPYQLGQVLRDLGRIDEALDMLREAVCRRPDLAHVRIALADALYNRGMKEEGTAEMRKAVETDPGFLLGWTKLGDAEQYANRWDDALDCYDRAMAIAGSNYDQSPFRLVCNALYMRGQHEKAEVLMRDWMQRSSWMANQPHIRTQAEKPRIALFCGLGRCNTPTDYIIDPNRLFVESICMVDEFDYPAENLDNCFDIVFNSASDADAAEKPIAIAEKVAARLKTPVLNKPSAMPGTRRHLTPGKLGGIKGLYVPRTELFVRAELRDAIDSKLANFNFPVLLRPTGSHGGDGLEKIETKAEIPAALDAMKSDSVYVTEFYDFSSSDGLFRKLRMMFVDHELYPVHMSISEHWLNHYFRTRTAQEEALRSEEARYLQKPDEYLGAEIYEGLKQVSKVHDLDYYGLDGAVDREGRLIVFECNATMLVKHRDQPATHDHKREAAERIQSAVRTMLVNKAKAF